ncbi:MAG: DUF4229 domain-containing protein [Actinomycetota bacterium]|jgi:hypothetical protein|nr:DUF4229 domain-containing protein [Actinomycetota bacterium]
MLQYTVWRLLIFLLFLLALLWLGVPSLWALVFAALFSMVTSFFLLRTQRDQLARQVESRVESGRARRQERLAAQRTDEDEEDADLEGR